jgi:hypothetical protein
MNYVTEPTEYSIRVTYRSRAGELVARCRDLGVESRSSISEGLAVDACARKVLAKVCPQGASALQRYCNGIWLCTVTPPAAN